jgi:hypothetical protein
MLVYIAVVVTVNFLLGLAYLRIKLLHRAELEATIREAREQRAGEHTDVVGLLRLIREMVVAARDNRVETGAKVEEIKRVLVDSPTREDIRQEIKSVPDKTAERVVEVLPDVLADTLKGGGKNGGHD